MEQTLRDSCCAQVSKGYDECMVRGREITAAKQQRCRNSMVSWLFKGGLGDQGREKTLADLSRTFVSPPGGTSPTHEPPPAPRSLRSSQPDRPTRELPC